MNALQHLSVVAVVLITGCGAVYPEIGTRLAAVRADQKLDPPPPTR